MEELSLSQLAVLIKETINISFDSYYWVTAEIHQLNVNYSGHCYLVLVEKDEKSDAVKANLRAVIWANKYRILSEYFREITKSELKAGIKVLIRVEVNFHPVYGLSLIINDIDPRYTLGDIAKRRQEIIKQLEDDGIIDLNKSLEFPVVPQRIAIISSATAAGLSDFLNHLNSNEYGYVFYTELFEAVMQGENTEKTIISALNRIYEKIEDFDIVVIIRGGGSKLDLSAFDSYQIASHIAQFPIPVLTGIGHQIDLSIADMVAWKSLKTPTATADFVITKTADFEMEISDLYDNIVNHCKSKIQEETGFLEALRNSLNHGVRRIITVTKEDLAIIDKKTQRVVIEFLNKKRKSLFEYASKISYSGSLYLKSENQNLNNYETKMINVTRRLFISMKKQLEIFEKIIDSNDPAHILKLGYSITTADGKVITSAEDVEDGKIIETRLKNGKIFSEVRKKM